VGYETIPRVCVLCPSVTQVYDLPAATLI